MLDQHVIREKAIRLAVRTGIAPDLDFVWTTQRKETGRVCFGLFEPTCDPSCYWYDRCRALAAEPVERAAEEDALPTERLRSRPAEPRRDAPAHNAERAGPAPAGPPDRWMPDWLGDRRVPVRRKPPL